MALNFPVDPNSSAIPYTPPILGFDSRWAPILQLLQQQQQAGYNPSAPDDTDINTFNNTSLPMWKRVGLQGPPTQQPSIPIQSPQGSPPQGVETPNPPRLQSTPNSPALIGGSPNMALTNGSGYPIGGLPTQSPMTELYQFNQMQSAQPLINGQPDLARMQRQQQNLQNFKRLLARLGGYSFQG